MMKYPLQTLGCRSLLAVLLFLSSLPMLQARIGESREAIERRLFASGGIVYRDDATEANRRRGMPYEKYLTFLPSSWDVRIYFKTADGSRPQSSNMDPRRMSPGWDMHVIYMRGQSKIEVYKRSTGITEYEMNALLAAHADGSYWNKVDPKDKETKSMPSAFGFDMVRQDGTVRAKKLGGDSVMVFDAELDAQLAELNDASLQSAAPASVNGF
ncbi:hypothetical protein [Coraliomargarita parva]|uniref:hypothetical protein n=1 Tax=Coraliomargarita parva TaxID=3014050 RepID=UPI0022B41910|nr:hypothetical protein [Coraliomargarita parva]